MLCFQVLRRMVRRWNRWSELVLKDGSTIMIINMRFSMMCC